MDTSVLETKKRYLATLKQAHNAAYDALEWAPEFDKPGIKKKIERLEQDIAEEQRGIARLEFDHQGALRAELPTDDFGRQVQDIIQNHLHEMDFETAVRDVKSIVGRFKAKGGTAAFLLRNSHWMCGDRCVIRIKSALHPPWGEDFKHYPVRFSDFESLEARLFLHKLYQQIEWGSDQRVDPFTDDIVQCREVIVGKITAPRRMPTVALIEIVIPHNLANYIEFIHWLLNDFWGAVVRQHREGTQKILEINQHYEGIQEGPKTNQKLPALKLVALLIAHSPVPDTCFKDFRCTKRRYSSERVLELPLRNWELSDIRRWLRGCIKEIDSTWELTEQEVAEIDYTATRIYQHTDNGTPYWVAEKLPHALADLIRRRRQIGS
jgi:hypothetical protein